MQVSLDEDGRDEPAIKMDRLALGIEPRCDRRDLSRGDPDVATLPIVELRVLQDEIHDHPSPSDTRVRRACLRIGAPQTFVDGSRPTMPRRRLPLADRPRHPARQSQNCPKYRHLIPETTADPPSACGRGQ